MTPVEIARAQLGKPWRHQARGPDFWDCVGLLTIAFPSLKDITTYGRDPHDGLLEKHMESQFGKPIPISQMRPNDAVAIAFPKIIRHVGIIGDYLYGGLSLIHTNGSVGCVTEHRLDERWLRRIKRVYRLGESA